MGGLRGYASRMRTILALLLLLNAPIGAWACTLARVAEWPVRLENGVPVVDGSIDGKRVTVQIDTGTPQSLVTKPAATRLGLYTTQRDVLAVQMRDPGVAEETARIAELRIGKQVQSHFSVVVLNAERPYDFTLGDDFFERIDLELDLPGGMIRLFEPRDCGSRTLAYWSPDTAARVPLKQGALIRFPALVDGIELEASLYTGNDVSTVAARAAGGAKPGCATLKSLELGGRVIPQPVLEVAKGSPSEPLVLGTDFLRAHRVYVSRQQRMLYFTHAGADAFARACR